MNIRIGFWLLLVLMFISGCTDRQKVSSGGNLAEVQDTNDRFPAFLAGVWEADAFSWAFKFEPDGRISKLIHTIGVPIKVEEGLYYAENPDSNNFEIFILGPCDTSYDPNTEVLKVAIILDYYRIEIPAGVVEGSSKDFFEGPVSAKDLVWNVKWRSYGYLEGADPPDVNAINENPQPLIFKKLDMEKLNPKKSSELQ
jgi:hypothetical protein